MLCVPEDYYTWLVTGEDTHSPPYGSCYWSNDCACSNDVDDMNLTIWACFEECNPLDPGREHDLGTHPDALRVVRGSGGQSLPQRCILFNSAGV